MKKLLVATMMCISLTAFFSCAKDVSTVQFINTSDDPYSVFIDNEIKSSLAGNTSTTYTVNPGVHIYEVVQQSGFLVSPKDEKGTFSVTKGGSAGVNFP